jgi:hypothetical protein
MLLRARSSILLACLGLVVALALWSCGSGKGNEGFGGPGDGGVGDDGTAGDDGGIAFNDSATNNDSGGPPAACDPTSCMAAGGMCTNGACVITENPGNIDPTKQGQLTGGGTADSAFKWLYPYDKTVFPRGLIPPTLQFGGANPDAAYVHVTFPGFDYQGFYGASSPGRIKFSKVVWTALTLAATAHSDVKVDVTKMSGGQVTGPITETWNIAQGSLTGTIYYETYDSQLAGGLGSVGIMRIDPGATTPVVIKSGCGNVCHTASADGSTLVANTQLSFGSASYDLKNNVATIKAQSDLSFTYGALYPDGSFLMSATSYRTWAPGFPGSPASKLWDTHTGLNIPAPGWDGVITNAGTVAFSPDGKQIAFNHEDNGGGHTLAAMNFDVGTKTFSGLADIAHDSGNTLAWPAFTPDGKWVVYHAGSNTAFETDSDATGDVYIVDIATHTMHRLDALDGYTGSGSTTYLPANDPNLSFAPTVLPVAVGGYFWTVFTSHRSYGNTLVSKDNMDEYGKLWVAAIDLSPTAGQDASHPAFFLDGQELAADNLRGFWVLNPCKAAGASCESGDQCCDGFCRPGGDGGALQCVAPPGGCSNESEKCTTAADCCNHADSCINSHCAQPPPR